MNIRIRFDEALWRRSANEQGIVTSDPSSMFQCALCGAAIAPEDYHGKTFNIILYGTAVVYFGEQGRDMGYKGDYVRCPRCDEILSLDYHVLSPTDSAELIRERELERDVQQAAQLEDEREQQEPLL